MLAHSAHPDPWTLTVPSAATAAAASLSGRHINNISELRPGVLDHR